MSRWSKEEDAMLRLAHEGGRYPKLAELHAVLPNRSFDAVKRRAFKLGLRHGGGSADDGALRASFTYTFDEHERAYLETAARIRKISFRALLRRLVKVIIAEQLVVAVLDDVRHDDQTDSA